MDIRNASFFCAPETLSLILPVLLFITSNLPALAAEPALLLPREGVCMNNLYAGTIGGDLNIRLFLARQGKELMGFYYYDKNGKFDPATNRIEHPHLQLQGKVEGNGQFMLMESDSGKAGDKRLGHFSGAFDAQGQAKGTWENPTGERKFPFQFHPSDTLEQGQKPRYRLRFTPVGDDHRNTSQIRLAIEGKKETLLTEEDNKAASACYAEDGYDFSYPVLDPDSVTVRLLHGQPNLYWIRYEIGEYMGSSTTFKERHQVVRADDPGKLVFDESTYDANDMHQGWGHAWQEKFTFAYQGSTLNVKKESGETEYADGSACGDYSEDSISKINLKHSIRKRSRTIAAGTSQVTSDKPIRAEELLPMRLLCKGEDDKERGVTPRSFLFLDDSISGWLVVRDNQLLNNSDGDLSPQHPVPDPEKPGQIPVIAACWLYNRVPWNETDASRAYPPAPPDQVRPNAFVPKECCELEVTADGKRALLYEKTGGNAKKPGRLLAMFDSPSGSCYSVNLERSGPWGKALALSANLEEQARTCRSPQTSADGSPTATESLDQQQRITLGSRVRVRPDPELGCGQLDRLPVGTVVSARKRTASPSRVDGAEDRWYQVETPSGATGWVFGGLLFPFDQAHPEQAYREIVERHLASEAGTLPEEVEFLEFLARVRPNLPEVLVPDFELARLRGIARALDHFTVPTAPPPQKASWMAGIEPYVTPMNDGGPYGLSPGAYWALHERYRHHPAAERLAWAAARADASWECEDSICAFVVNVSPLVRYLQQYPSGANAAEAVRGIIERLDMLDKNLKANSIRRCQVADLGDDPDDRKTFRKTLKQAANALRQVKNEQAANAIGRLEEFVKTCKAASSMKSRGLAH